MWPIEGGGGLQEETCVDWLYSGVTVSEIKGHLGDQKKKKKKKGQCSVTLGSCHYKRNKIHLCLVALAGWTLWPENLL